ncbi:hypothetical protein [Streptomyces chryseus]|uniref:Uncharacterized protein n=1 Tax=Streptomyces chryseus TaxID=68186 RepID=A0ABQ3DRP1_9ACTN|nr:hypothetical protein [Streptomyces chryseus]GGX06042.1 hypothetical protein GCM10010353_21810 [Streptomyces chryseus]GHB12291.1 hypothetical protein GCM10010346_39710 [Streptomyces chryseus]
MSVDPTDPETFAEEETPDEPAVLDNDASEADAAEQRTEWQQAYDDRPTGIDTGEAADADAAEQARVVAVDEDDYR